MKCSLSFLFILLPFCMSAKEGAAPSNLQNKSSLAFIENKGQIIDQNGKQRKDIDFKLEANGMVMFVGANQLHYQWFSNEKCKSQKPKAAFREDRLTRESPLKGDLGVDIYRLDVELLNANPNPEVITEELQDYTENYYLSQCPDGATAHSFKKITYKNVYPNIDWVIYINSKFKSQKSKSEEITNEIKYDFLVRPGGNYADIKLLYKGATKLELKDGALIATTPFGSITENAPFSYWANTNEEVSTNFVLNGNVLSYIIPSITNHQSITNPLAIDPILRWATYYGGSGDDRPKALATDTAGNVYMTGATTSMSNIATTGAHQTSYGGSTNDGFVVKFNVAGVIQWATYYGGSNDDYFQGIGTDVNGNVYLSGDTKSTTGIASTGAYQTSISNSDYDAMLVKLNSNGVRQWATYFGGTDGDEGNSVSCDATGNVYMVGFTNSAGLATVGAFQTSLAGGNSYFVKFNINGVRQWCTYYNGTSIGFDVNCSLNGDVYISGNSNLTTGIATTGAHQTTKGSAGTGVDGYLAKFTSSGTRLWGTYYGGNNGAYLTRITCDRAGNVYACGNTGSTSGMATTGAHQGSFAGGMGDGFIVKFNGSGVRQWGTYYGGIYEDRINDIATDPLNNVYVYGNTKSSTGIATANAYQQLLGGTPNLERDGFVAMFNTSGVREYSTYYGGANEESGYIAPCGEGGIGWAKGKIYFCDMTNSTSGISTTGAYQTSFAGGGNGDAFLVQFDADTAVYLNLPYTDTFRCAGDSIHVPFGVTQNFRSTNSFTLQLSNASGSFASPTTLATISGGAAGAFHTIVPLSITTGSGYRLRVLATAPADTSEDNGVDLRYAQYPATPVASANTPLCSGNTLNLNATGTSTAVWSWSGPGSYSASTQNTNITNAQTTNSGSYIVSANLNNGCIRKDTVTVVVNQTPAKPNAGSNSPLCSGNTLNLTSSSTTSGVSWNWTGPMGFGNTSQNPSIPNVQTNQAGDYIVTATLGPCNSKDTTTVVVNPGPTINTYVNPKDTICAGSSVTLVALVTNGGSGPSYQWYKNGNPIGGATSASYIASGLNNGDVFYCQFTPGSGTGCNGSINSSSITIAVLPITNPSVTITASPDTNIWQGLNVTFTATANNCSKPAYQWKLNGNNVSGATSNSWGAATLLDNDQVSCVMTCNDPCPNPKDATSNKLTIHVAAGISGVNQFGVSIYPNPVTNELIIETPAPFMERAGARLFDVLGREVYRGVINSSKHIVNTSALVAGTYVLQLTSTTGGRVMYKVVKE